MIIWNSGLLPSSVPPGGIGQALYDTLDANHEFLQVHRIGRSDPAIDITNEASVESCAKSLADHGISPDLITVATGMLHNAIAAPEKSSRNLDPDWTMENYRVNAIGPALVGKHFLPLMPKDRRICLAMLSARVGSISDNRLSEWPAIAHRRQRCICSSATWQLDGSAGIRGR